MKRKEMIKSHQEFSAIIKKEKYLKNKEFTIYIRQSKFTYPHFGIAVSKRLGNAVVRNKQKRRMRVILDEYKKTLNENMDYIIIMKENVVNLTFDELKNSFQNLINRNGEKNETKK